MNKLQRITLGLALAITLTCGASASAKSGDSTRRSPRALTGTVLRIDLRTRTLEVRDESTGRVVNVRVPERALLRTNISTQSFMPIERLTAGMTIQNVIVE